MSKNAICILSVYANNDTFSFAETLKNDSYDIYICIDNNNSILPEFDKSKITVIRFYDKECEDNHFYGSVVYAHDRACSRDKALYYFCKINTNYDYIWFLEEDVFIPTKNTIQRIDNLYINTNADILSQNNTVKRSHDDPNAGCWMHWWRNENKTNYPWAFSMISAIRVSKKLLECISNFVKTNKCLLFDELLFNTIAVQNNLIIETPSELSTIHFSFNDIIPTTVNPNFLYHPIKNLLKQNELRQQL